jgi:ribosome-associated toxin RatA of RatAB toxin-antitoxin module
VGAILDITVHHAGTTRFAAKTTEIIENQLIRVEFVEGDFVGEGKWTFDPENGRTKIWFRWKVRPNRLLTRVISRFIDIGKLHSEVTQAGFEGLNEYLKQKEEALA